jgi:hypothetical protein
LTTLFISTFPSAALSIPIRVRVTPQAQKHTGGAVSNVLALRDLGLFGAFFTLGGNRRAQQAILVRLGIAISRLL